MSLESQNGLLALLAYSGVGNSPLAVESETVPQETVPQETASNETEEKDGGTC